MIRPVKCLGKGRCFWYDLIETNDEEKGICGYSLYESVKFDFLLLREVLANKNFQKGKKVEVGKTECPYRKGMYNYCEPEFI